MMSATEHSRGPRFPTKKSFRRSWKEGRFAHNPSPTPRHVPRIPEGQELTRRYVDSACDVRNSTGSRPCSEELSLPSRSPCVAWLMDTVRQDVSSSCAPQLSMVAAMTLGGKLH